MAFGISFFFKFFYLYFNISHAQYSKVSTITTNSFVKRFYCLQESLL